MPALAETLRHNAGSLAEIIVVDDASTDGSADLLQQLTVNIPNCTYLYNTINAGPFRTRLRGISASKSRWVQLLDADDELLNVPTDEELASVELASPLPAALAYKADLKTEMMCSLLDVVARGWPNSSNIVVRKDTCGDLRENTRLEWGEDHVFFSQLFLRGDLLYRPGNLARYNKDCAERSITGGSIRNRIACAREIYRVSAYRSILAALTVSGFFLIRTLIAGVLKQRVRGRPFWR